MMMLERLTCRAKAALPASDLIGAKLALHARPLGRRLPLKELIGW